MARVLGICHDCLQRILVKSGIMLFLFPKLTVSIAKFFSKQKSGWLIVDDTLLLKPFIKFLAGVYTIYNTVMGRTDRGLCLVVVAWSNGQVTIPLMFKFHYHRDIVGASYEKKAAIAERMVLKIKAQRIIKFRYVLFDAHYSTIPMLNALQKMRIKFIAKITRTRKIRTKNGEYEQLQHHSKLKLIRNYRSRRVRAEFGGLSLFFSSHKRKKRNGEYAYTYIVSNMRLTAKDYLAIYEDRWAIEEMFRTIKQYLGLSHCQSVELERQSAHIYMIFIAYSFLEKEKVKHGFKNPETSLKHLQKMKLDNAMDCLTSFSKIFDCV